MNGRDLLRRIPGLPAALAGRDDVWLVGGAVRDLALGREPRELDFVVEGDAVALARALGGAVVVHERFRTATVAGMDLASARRERYPAPGALPEVELGASVEEDLARRDFTVNAIAVRLSDGRVAAWPGAEDDLARGVLRVLHAASFRDDPTRLLRLARYGARLAFEPDPETARLAAEAVAGGATATVSGARLGEELRLLLAEPQPAALERLARDGLGTAVLGPAFRVDAPVVAKARDLWPSGAAALAACLYGAPVVDLRERLDALAFPAAERDAVLAAATRAPGLAEALGAVAGGPPSAIHAAARAERPETVAVAGAAGAFDPARRYLHELRHVSLDITGHDLAAAGLRGEAIGAGLAAALAARLDGLARGREEELVAALASGR